jgi:hypothetical protein
MHRNSDGTNTEHIRTNTEHIRTNTEHIRTNTEQILNTSEQILNKYWTHQNKYWTHQNKYWTHQNKYWTHQNKYWTCRNGLITFVLTDTKRNSDLKGNVSESLLDKEVDGREKIKDVKEINNKETPSLSFETSSFQEFCLPYKFFPHIFSTILVQDGHKWFWDCDVSFKSIRDIPCVCVCVCVYVCVCVCVCV